MWSINHSAFMWQICKTLCNWGRLGDGNVNQCQIISHSNYWSYLQPANTLIYIHMQPFCTCKSIYATILHMYIIYTTFLWHEISFNAEGLSENWDNILHKWVSNNLIIRAWVVLAYLHLYGISTHPFSVFFWPWCKMLGNWGRFGDRKVNQFWTIALLLSYLPLLIHINIHI